MRTLIFSSVLILCLLSSGCDDPSDNENLTGVEVTLTSGIFMDQVHLLAVVDGNVSLGSVTLPEPPRPLNGQGESVVVLIDETHATKELTLRVDGFATDELAASGRGTIDLVAKEIVSISIHLGSPIECGDGQTELPVEDCDDGNTANGDGCSQFCLIEPGYTCEIIDDGSSYCEPVESPDGDADIDSDMDSDIDADADTDSPCTEHEQCDNEVFCDGLEQCDFDSGQCLDGESPSCNDGIDCTTDRCDTELDQCVNDPDDDECTGSGGTCDPVEGCSHTIWVDASCFGVCGLGTESAPYQTIGEAFDDLVESPIPYVIRIAEGNYNESEAMLASGVTLNVTIRGGPDVVWTNGGFVGLRAASSAQVKLSDVVIQQTKAGVRCMDRAKCLIENVWLIQNGRYGLVAEGNAEITVKRSAIGYNQEGGVALIGSSRITAINTLIGQNGREKAASGGVYSQDTSTFRCINCTIADNMSMNAGAVYTDTGASSSLVNTIVWNNGEPASSQCRGCSFESCLEGETNPSFVLSTDRFYPEDYQITALSLARDEGTSGDEIPEVDYFGNERADDFVDIGFHEF